MPGPAEPGGPSLDGPGREEDRHPPRARHTAASAESAALVPFDPSGDSRQVASITLDRRLTGGISAGDGEGDQGLLVVVEPRDAAGRPVDAPAEVSVVVYDPAVQEEDGHAALVARWDFSAAETAALFRRAGPEQAIHLAGGWPAELPKHNQLHVFVRYVTADGRKLEADRPVEVALRGDRTARRNHAEAPPTVARRARRRTSPAAPNGRRNDGNCHWGRDQGSWYNHRRGLSSGEIQCLSRFTALIVDRDGSCSSSPTCSDKSDVFAHRIAYGPCSCDPPGPDRRGRRPDGAYGPDQPVRPQVPRFQQRPAEPPPPPSGRPRPSRRRRRSR